MNFNGSFDSNKNNINGKNYNKSIKFKTRFDLNIAVSNKSASSNGSVMNYYNLLSPTKNTHKDEW